MGQTELSFRPQTPAPASAPTVMTVGELVRAANTTLEGRFGVVWVEGEVSNLKVGAAGHAFFTLKDADAMLPVAMWRANVARLAFELQDGQILRVCGRLGIFAKQGRVQLYGEQAEPAGLGALMLALEQLKARLANEGLFAAERKRPLPRWPTTVGLVTSAQGAALHDILQVAARRCPTRFVLAPALVQGPEAPKSLIRGLHALQKRGEIDVIIIGRGGGSVEDLWAFNDEALARAVAACSVPVVSAVGHEVDTTICDLVADMRAATPSQAAELVVPDRQTWVAAHQALQQRLYRALERRNLDLRARLDHCFLQLKAVARGFTSTRRATLQRWSRALQQLHPRAALTRDRRALEGLRERATTSLVRQAQVRRSRMDELSRRLREAGLSMGQPAGLRLARAASALQALSPLAVLQRGYAVVTREDGGVVRRADDTNIGEQLAVRLSVGRLVVRVDGIEGGETG